MNHYTRAQPSPAATAYLDETTLSVRRSLDDAITVYDNADTIMREKALDAILEGRAAYWTTASYHNAIASDLPYALNAGVEIARAVDDAYERRQWAKDGALDTIVPLNRKAALALSVAYSMHGLWRDEEELLIRAKRDCRRVA